MKKTAFIILFGFISSIGYAQTDSLGTVNPSTLNQDSTVVNSADKVVELIFTSDSLSLADSINTIILQRQLEELRSYEKSKRRQLEKELADIRAADSLRRVNMMDEISLLKTSAVGHSIVIESATVLTIYTKIGSLTPSERAKLVHDRLSDLYQVFLLIRTPFR